MGVTLQSADQRNITTKNCCRVTPTQNVKKTNIPPECFAQALCHQAKVPRGADKAPLLGREILRGRVGENPSLPCTFSMNQLPHPQRVSIQDINQGSWALQEDFWAQTWPTYPELFKWGYLVPSRYLQQQVRGVVAPSNSYSSSCWKITQNVHSHGTKQSFPCKKDCFSDL